MKHLLVPFLIFFVVISIADVSLSLARRHGYEGDCVVGNSADEPTRCSYAVYRHDQIGFPTFASLDFRDSFSPTSWNIRSFSIAAFMVNLVWTVLLSGIASLANYWRFLRRALRP